MKVLVIGSGGREHALVWKIAKSPKVKKIYCAPGNPGTAQFAENTDIGVNDINGLVEFTLKEKIDMTVVGPEAPLIAGITDLFEKNGLAIIGPTARAARLEGSKIYAKKVMLWNKIPTARFACFDEHEYVKEFLKTQKYPLVIKAEGQCLGKGVKVCNNEQEAQKFAREAMVENIFGDEGKRIVIEEYLEGQEISFMVATDGVDFISFIPSQDHKRIGEGDTGPNTGGMGAYAPVPFISGELVKQIEKDIVAPTIRALREHDNPYRGILYPGLILTKDGPKVLEYNCRFGDPETQPLMALLDTDLIEIFTAIRNRSIKGLKLKWKNASSVCVVLAAKGYPGTYEKGHVIQGLDNVSDRDDLMAFHAGTKCTDGKTVTNGGRVIGVTATGNTLQDAREKAYEAIGKNGIRFTGMQYRKDIGIKGLDKKLWEI